MSGHCLVISKSLILINKMPFLRQSVAWRNWPDSTGLRSVPDKNIQPLKQFLVAGNYNHARIGEHVHYEAALVRILAERGIATAAIVPLANGDAVATLDSASAMLFERLHATQCKRPEYPLDRVAEAIAGYHLRQIEKPIPLEAAFTFDQMWEIWCAAFERYRASGKQPEVLAEQLIDHYIQLAPLTAAEKRALPVVVRLFGLLKFTKEVRGYEEVAGSTMRTARATAIARFLQR